MKIMSDYTIYCTEKQTRKALELGAPIEVTKRLEPLVNRRYISDLENYTAIIIPTAEEMIGWLENQHVRVYAQPYTDECDKRFKGKIHTVGERVIKVSKSRKEALIASIDAALDYLTNNKK